MRTPGGQHANTTIASDDGPPNASAAVRSLSARLKELRRRHHDTALQKALAVTQGENLALRRKLAAYE
jgi:hypothetical protein